MAGETRHGGEGEVSASFQGEPSYFAPKIAHPPPPSSNIKVLKVTGVAETLYSAWRAGGDKSSLMGGAYGIRKTSVLRGPVSS